MKLGDIFPNFKAATSQGDVEFHSFLGDAWGIMFSHPADYTPVCTTELARVVDLMDEFKKRNVKVIGLSIDSVADHKGFAKDVMEYAGKGPVDLPFPLIADKDRKLAVQLGMLDPDEKDSGGLPLTCRAVFIVGPDKRLKLSILYPATTGRNFEEIIRVIDSLQLTAVKKVATPAEWKPGQKCMVVPSVKKEELATLFPKGVDTKKLPSGKEYLRFTPQP